MQRPFAAALFAAVFFFTAASTLAQTSASAAERRERILERIDIGLTADGLLNHTVSGTVYPAAAPNAGTTLTDSPSSSVGFRFNARYIVKPFLGFEGNATYGRYSQNFTSSNGTSTTVQNNAEEFTLGYVVTPQRQFFGFTPSVSVGTGSYVFRPTRGGGDNFEAQARQAYYYNVALQQQEFNSHFGVRAGFRQVFFLAPDYGQNFLTIKKRSFSSEPYIGIYLKF